MPWNQDGAGKAKPTIFEYIDGVYSYAMVLTSNHMEAEELVQKTYVRAIPEMQRLPSDVNVKGWLFTILRDIWLNQLRSRCSSPQIAEINDNNGVNRIVVRSNDSHDLYVTKMEIEQVRGAIQALPIEFREIILLRDCEELSYAEIAAVLDCPLGSVMLCLARARTKIRALLSARWNGETLPE